MEEWAYPYAMADYFCLNNSCNGFVPAASTPCVDITKFWAGQPPDKYLFFELNAAGVSGVGVVDSNSPTGGPAAMKALRDIGPLSINVAAMNWYSYEEGVYNNSDKNGAYNEWQIDHAVQLVGYGYDKELDENYWLVRNSWSTLWGENGYIRLWRPKGPNATEPCGHSGSYQVCGTSGCLNDVTFPIVYKADPIKPFGY